MIHKKRGSHREAASPFASVRLTSFPQPERGRALERVPVQEPPQGLERVPQQVLLPVRALRQPQARLQLREQQQESALALRQEER